MFPVGRSNIELGRWGEQLAESQLVKAGAKVLERNYRFEPGEIDLLIEHDGDLVAVEVKTRTDLDLEKPEEAVTRWKMRRMILGLQTYAAANDMLEIRVLERTAELRAAQDELVHAGKLAALGQMSAGIVHELNQPLAALQTAADNAIYFGQEEGRSSTWPSWRTFSSRRSGLA